MVELKSTMMLPDSSNKISLDEDELSGICEWLSGLDREVSYNPLNLGQNNEMFGYIIEVEYFNDTDIVSVRDPETEDGVMMSVEDLLSKV